MASLREHLTEEKTFSFGHCPNYLSPSSGQAADGGPSWMSKLAFSIPSSVEVVRVSKLRKSSPCKAPHVKHLLDVWISTTAHILETKSELEKDLWSSKSCY